eukprot:292475-Prorocentrum_minimum.AAC.1
MSNCLPSVIPRPPADRPQLRCIRPSKLDVSTVLRKFSRQDVVWDGELMRRPTIMIANESVRNENA